ncbi:MAG: helix-turn-helix domain-containing protein [Bdellovibrionota bacterium]
MNFQAVHFNNHKRSITFSYPDQTQFSLHYSKLGIPETIQEAWLYNEGPQKVCLFHASGEVEYVPAAKVLKANASSDSGFEASVEKLVTELENRLHAKRISQRELARALKTSQPHVARLLKREYLKSKLGQIAAIAETLETELEVRIKPKKA